MCYNLLTGNQANYRRTQMTAIHHAIIKAVANAGCTIREIDGEFELTNHAYGLRATGKDPRVLRALAQQWMNDEESREDYVVEEEFEDEVEEGSTGSVVKETYKARYKERGNANNCGDWLARQLEVLTHNPKGEFDIEAFINIIEMNGILDHHRYRRETGADRGRFRMSCRIRLAKIIKDAGVLKTPDGIIEVPETF